MTDKQSITDPIATAARLLREAAEELRQAHAFPGIEGWENETDAKAAYDEHMAAAQALEDWEEAIGAGGVSGPLVGKPQEMPYWMQYDERNDVLTINGKRYAAGMFGADGFLSPPGTWLRVCVGAEDCVTLSRASLAASPTLPAEQQATTTEAALEGVYAELPAPNLPRGGFPDLFTEGQMRDFADRTHAKRASHGQAPAPLQRLHDLLYAAQRQTSRDAMHGAITAARIELSKLMAAPKAAPGDEGKALAALRYYMHECSGAEPSISVFHRMAEEALEVAPQQEPALFVSPKQLAALTDPDDPEGEHGRYLPARKTSKGLFTQPLYTAPQPAPAPLSDDTKDAARWRWLSEHIGVAWNEGKFTSLVRIVSDKNRTALNASIDRMMAGDWSYAALAAQGGQ